MTQPRSRSLACILSLGLSLSLSACPASKPVMKAKLGRGGLPTNDMSGVTAQGTAGVVMTVPADLLYPGAKEIKGRPFFYQTGDTVDKVLGWCKEHIPGATELEVSKQFRTLQGTEWSVDIYDESGGAVVKYVNTKYRPK